jgi:HEAT repeat protein
MIAFFSSVAKAMALIVSGAMTVVATGAAAIAPLPGWSPISIVWSPISNVVEQDAELAALIEQLGAPAARDRAMAACRIGRMRNRDVSAARDALLALLGDGEPVERRLCRERGNWIGDRDEDSSPGREAAIALERVGSPALDPLIGILGGDREPGGDNAVAREHAAMALGLIEERRAVAPLVTALDDEVEGVRARSAWALGMIEDSAAVEPLGDAITDASARVRSQAAWALGMIEAAAAVPALSAALGDEAVEVREEAAWALGMIEASSAVPGLTSALQDESADVREQAAWALGMIEDSAAVDALLDALEDEDNEVRKQAIWALMRCIDEDTADYEQLAAKLRRALIGG